MDGFNLYHGLRESTNCRHLRWLNLRSLIEGILLPRHVLETVTFFTSVLTSDPGKERRHRTYLDALRWANVEVVEGRFQMDEKQCRAECGKMFWSPVEKLTDVNISTRMVTDAIRDRFDWAYLVSGDADQVPTLIAVRQIAPQKKVRVIFPPRRKSLGLLPYSTSTYGELGANTLRANQFDDVFRDHTGRYIRKPQRWIDQEAGRQMADD